VLICKSCGKHIEIEEGVTVCECKNCGITQTVPKVYDSTEMILFHDANTLLFNCKFDKASKEFERIISDYSDEAEAYWGLILCKYGIEYIDDPVTTKKILTCRRSSFENVMDDPNFELVIKNADTRALPIYREKAQQIEELRKNNIGVSINDGIQNNSDNTIEFSDTPFSEKLISLIQSQKHFLETARLSTVKMKDECRKLIHDSNCSIGINVNGFYIIGLKSDGTVLSLKRSESEPDDEKIQSTIREWKDIISIAIGSNHVVGLKSDGTVVAVGDNKHNQCNIGEWHDIVSIFSDFSYTLGLKSNGTVVTTGFNENGVLGQVNDWHNIIAISVELNHIVGLMSNGTVVSVGPNEEHKRQLSNWHNIIDIKSRGEYTVGLKSDGTVVVSCPYSGDERNLYDLSGWRDIVAISIGQDHVVGLKSNGTVVAADPNDDEDWYINLGVDSVDKWRDIVDIVAGNGYTIGLKTDGKLMISGKLDENICEVLNDWKLFNNNDDLTEIIERKKCIGKHNEKNFEESNILKECQKTIMNPDCPVLIMAGGNLNHSATFWLKSDGTVVAIGENKFGWNDIETWRDIVSVAIGDHTAGLKSDGTVVTIGFNNHGECDVGEWHDITKIAVGEGYTVGLKSDGTVVATGYNGYGQCNVRDWCNIVSISVCSYQTIGLKSDGTVVATGENDFNQCNVQDWNDIVAIVAGKEHTVGLKSNGTVLASGNNECGQCDVSGWRDIVAITVENDTTIGMKSDGTVVSTDYYDKNWMNITDVIAIASGNNHTVGLKSDGTVVAFGYNYYCECNVSEWRDIIAIAVGGSHTIGLKADGTVASTGYNENGCCNVFKWRLFDNINELKEVIEHKKIVAKEKRQEKVVVLRNEMTKLQTELSNLHGFFTKKRREAIEKKLEYINHQLTILGKN